MSTEALVVAAVAVVVIRSWPLLVLNASAEPEAHGASSCASGSDRVRATCREGDARQTDKS